MAQPRKCTTEFVQNDKARLATFKRRSHCLLNKASELSTLCDVDVAVLIYADHLPDRPLVYPLESGESLRIVKKLKENPRRVPASKSNRIVKKLKENPRCVPVSKSKPDKFLNQANHRKGPNDMFCEDITSLNADELNSLLRVLDAKEADVLQKIEAMEQRKNDAAVVEVSDPNRLLFNGIDHHSKLFDHQPHGFQGQISFSLVDNEDSGEQMIENNYGFLNLISGHINDNYNDEITSSNVEEGAVDEISDPNCFNFTGDDRHSALFDPQLDGLQWPISFSGHPNHNHYDELMSLDISESDLAQIMDYLYEDEIETIGEKSDQMPNCWNFPESFSDEFSGPECFFLNGCGWQNPRVFETAASSSSYSSGEMPIPCFYKVGEDTPISEPNHLTEINSWLLDDVNEPEEAKDESNSIDEKTIETTDCESFSENSDGESSAAMFYDEVPDTNCLPFNSENSMYDGYELLDYQRFGFQRAIPCS